MSKKPVITVPDTSKSPDTGLVWVKDVPYASYTEDGVRKRFMLKAGFPVEARKARDRFYRKLLKEGATIATRGPRPSDRLKRRRERVTKDPMAYIRHEPAVANKPWSYRFGKEVGGRFKTKAEAQAARDKELGIKP